MLKENNNGKVIIRISIVWLFLLVIILLSFVEFFRNNIFAVNDDENEIIEDNTIVIEKNNNQVDTLGLMIENNYKNKKLINEQRDIPFETKVFETDKLPKGEEMVYQAGVIGNKQVTALQNYNEEDLVGEDIIEETIKEQPVTEIRYKGTSSFLSKYKVHIGEEMYLLESCDIKKEKKDDSETVYSLKRFLNIKLLDNSEQEEWVKVSYNKNEGYIKKDKLTSEYVMPKIKEKNRIAKLQDGLKIDMDLSKPSGLTRSDYITIFKDNKNDKNKIFENNAEVFMKVEQEYKINGVFLASIGIHESAWGTSNIAKEKNNLFGYKAYDRDPGKYAQDFESYEECIRFVGKAVAKNYLNPEGSYYNEPTLEGVNKKYASDQEWHLKVYKYMEYLYDKLE